MSDVPVDPVVTARLALDNYVLTVVAFQPDEWDVTPFVNRVLAAELRRLSAALGFEAGAAAAAGSDGCSGLLRAIGIAERRADDLDPQGGAR